jgi:hypothetical protein
MKNSERILKDLRARGYRKYQCVEIFIETLGFSQKQAFDIVHNSEVWRDKFEKDNDSRRLLLQIEPLLEES